MVDLVAHEARLGGALLALSEVVIDCPANDARRSLSRSEPDPCMIMPLDFSYSALAVSAVSAAFRAASAWLS